MGRGTMLSRKDRLSIIQDALDAPGGLAMNVRIHRALEAAGAFIDNRPTYEAVAMELAGLLDAGFIIQRLVDAGLVQPKREEPAAEYVELIRVIAAQESFDHMAEPIARRMWAAGYRKRTEGGWDG